MVTMLKMESDKISQYNDQNVKVKLDDRTSINLMLTSIYRRINPQMFHECGKPMLEKFDKDWVILVVFAGSIIKWMGTKPVVCKWGEKGFITDLTLYVCVSV